MFERNYSWENVFYIHVHFHANQTHFPYMKFCTKTRCETEANQILVKSVVVIETRPLFLGFHDVNMLFDFLTFRSAHNKIRQLVWMAIYSNLLLVELQT